MSVTSSSRARLLLSLNPLCLKFAAKYRRPEHLSDLYQQAQIGAAEAIDTYVPGHGTRLSSWAWWSIRDKVGKYLKAEDRPARLAERLGIKMIELDAEIENEDGEGDTSMHELVALPDDDVPPDPGEHTRRAAVALATLAPRDRDIVERHIRRQTFAEIGAALHLSGERARQLYKGAIKNMLLAANGETRRGNQPRRAALQPADKLRKKIGSVTGKLRHDLLKADVNVSAGKYLKGREVSELRSIDRELADVVGSVQAGLKGAAFLRWKETRPTVDGVAARAPVASACEECGRAFKAAGRSKFCAAECSPQRPATRGLEGGLSAA